MPPTSPLFGAVVLEGRIEVGRRVWVADASANGRKATGVIASIPKDFLGTGGFIVLLDGEKTVVTCCNERRGSQRDFADRFGP